MDALNAMLPWIAGLLAGVLGAMGLGGGSILMLYLTLWAGLEQTAAQGINLAFFIPCAAVAVLLHAKQHQICWNAWKTAVPFGLAGAWLGTTAARMLEGGILRKIFAGFLLLYGLFELFHRGRKQKGRSSSRRFPHKHNAPGFLRKRGDGSSDLDQ